MGNECGPAEEVRGAWSHGVPSKERRTTTWKGSIQVNGFCGLGGALDEGGGEIPSGGHLRWRYFGADGELSAEKGWCSDPDRRKNVH